MIVVKIKGGFANQLFIYAFYLNLIEKYSDKDVYMDISYYKRDKSHGGFKLDKFATIRYLNNKNVHYSSKINENNIDYVKIENDKNYLFDGYWQSDLYFPKDMSPLYDIFNSINLNKKNERYRQLILQNTSVSLHVRRGDYIGNYMHGNIANKQYFINAINYINSKIENPLYFIFSDDIKWCKKNLGINKDKVVYITGNNKNVHIDIFLMTLCKINVISNSSFSWWGQKLNKNIDKIVLTPEYWFNQPTPSVKELVIENAVKIPNTLSKQSLDKTPFFSIIVPVYNTAKTLRRTFASVLNQSYESFELVVVNDSSTDNSLEIINTYANRDSRIRIINHEYNKKLLATRYTGMQNANGKYILLLDSDDYLDLEALNYLHKKLKKTPVDILEFQYIREPSKRHSPFVSSKRDRILALLNPNNPYPVTVWNKVYSKDVVRKVLDSFVPFSATFAEDSFYSFIFATYANSFGYLRKSLHHYNLGTGISTQEGISEKKVLGMLNDIVNIDNNLRKFIIEKMERKDIDIHEYIKHCYDYLFKQICYSESLHNIVSLLDLLDKNEHTKGYNYKEQFICMLHEYNNFMDASVAGKFKQIIKYFSRKLAAKM